MNIFVLCQVFFSTPLSKRRCAENYFDTPGQLSYVLAVGVNDMSKHMSIAPILYQNNTGESAVTFKKIVQYLLTPAVAAAAVYFFYLQFKQNADVIGTYHFQINYYYISLTLVIGIFSVFLGPYIWQLYVNDHLKNKLNYSESFAVFCTSSMFKYIPGKIWHYAAQIALMSSKGISKAALIYINLVCFIGFMFVSILFAAYYFLFCVQTVAWDVAVLLFALLIVLDIVFICWNTALVNYLIGPINRLFKVEIQPIKIRRSLLVYTQALYVVAYMLVASALYFMARGIGLGMPFPNIFSLMATISMAAMSSSLAIFTVGGLGVREGAMFLMLKQFSNIQTALILPIAARLGFLVIEVLAVMTAIMIGIKYGYFPDPAAEQTKK